MPCCTPTASLTPTLDPNTVRWALISSWGQWGVVGESEPAAVNFLAVPTEDWDMIRRQTYNAQGDSLPQYDTWAISRFATPLAQCGECDPRSPIVVVLDGEGKERYYAVRTTAGILVVAP